MGPIIDETQEALFNLADTLLQHGTDVQGNVGQGVGTSEAGPSHTQDPLTRSPDRTRDAYRTGYAEGLEHRVILHPCTMCGCICYKPASEFWDDRLLRYVSKTHYFHIIFFLYHNFQLFRNLFLFNYLTNYVNKYTAGVPWHTTVA